MPTETEVREALKNCYDPELRMDIVTLGLVYGIAIEGGIVHVKMTFTSPMCPYGPALIEDVKQCVHTLAGVTRTDVEIVFDPPWQPSEEIKAALGVG